jgi:hypothetical protein
MLRRKARYGSICAVLIAAGAAAAAIAQNDGTGGGMIVAAPDPCAAPADIPPPTLAGAIDAQGRPVAPANLPGTAPTLGSEIPVAIVTDLDARAGSTKAAGPRFDTLGHPATLAARGNRVIVNGTLVAPDPADAEAVRRAACAEGAKPAH